MGRKKANFDRERVEFVADPVWIERVTAAAARLGLSLSAYIRLAVSERMEPSEVARLDGREAVRTALAVLNEPSSPVGCRALLEKP